MTEPSVLAFLPTMRLVQAKAAAVMERAATVVRSFLFTVVIYTLFIVQKKHTSPLHPHVRKWSEGGCHATNDVRDCQDMSLAGLEAHVKTLDRMSKRTNAHIVHATLGIAAYGVKRDAAA